MLIPVKRWRTEASLSLSFTLSLSLSQFCTDSCYSTQQRGPRWAVGGGETFVGGGGVQKRQSNLKTLWMLDWSSAARRAERGVAGGRRTEDRQKREERREVGVGSCSGDAETHGETDWGIWRKTWNWIGRPIKLQNSRPRAPPAVYRGFPFASTTGGKFRTTPSPVDFILSLCTNQKRFDFLSFFFFCISLVHSHSISVRDCITAARGDNCNMCNWYISSQCISSMEFLATFWNYHNARYKYKKEYGGKLIYVSNIFNYFSIRKTDVNWI